MAKLDEWDNAEQIEKIGEEVEEARSAYFATDNEVAYGVEPVAFVEPDGYQEHGGRAHAYLEAHRVRRGYSDTAMQCAAEDLCRRAMAAGMAMAGPSGPVAEAFKAAAWYQDAAADALRAALGQGTDAATPRASS